MKLFIWSASHHKSIYLKVCNPIKWHIVEKYLFLEFLHFCFYISLQALLFNVSKPFSVGSGGFFTTEELMVDCFVSSFRINYRNNQHFDICLQPNSPIIFHLVYVKGTYAIVKEVNKFFQITMSRVHWIVSYKYRYQWWDSSSYQTVKQPIQNFFKLGLRFFLTVDSFNNW